MYYLFIRNKNKLKRYKTKLNEVKESIENGKTPVYNEMACAKTNMIESVPYNIINGVLTIASVFIINNIKLNEMLKIAVVLIINHLSGAFSNFIFVIIKHKLRLNLCKRLNVTPDEKTIAAMESLEYQTV